MVEPKRIDYKSIDNHLKSSMDKPQCKSNMRAMSLKADVTKEKLADLLPTTRHFHQMEDTSRGEQITLESQVSAGMGR